jgi:hypothetical protein
MATLRSLGARMERLATRIDTEILELKRVVVMAILRSLVGNTPVDTSRALSNWQVAVGDAMGTYIQARYAGRDGSTEAASAAATIAAGEAALDTAQPHDLLVIFNKAPYIRRLNEGSSRRRPGGFVEKAVLAGRIAARKHKLRLR